MSLLVSWCGGLTDLAGLHPGICEESLGVGDVLVSLVTQVLCQLYALLLHCVTVLACVAVWNDDLFPL